MPPFYAWKVLLIHVIMESWFVGNKKNFEFILLCAYLQAPSESPWAKCAGTAFSETSIVTCLPLLLFGWWYITTFELSLMLISSAQCSSGSVDTPFGHSDSSFTHVLEFGSQSWSDDAHGATRLRNLEYNLGKKEENHGILEWLKF